MIHFRVVKSVEQMDRARTGRGKTNANFASELRVSTRHECRHLFMANLDVIDGAIRAIQRAHDPVNSVAGIAVNAFQAPFVDSPYQKIARSFSHHNLYVAP